MQTGKRIFEMNHYQIVDQNGDTVVSADAIAAVARMQRSTPRQVAQRDARNMSNDIDGTFAAVRA
jgi:hypothetical protein